MSPAERDHAARLGDGSPGRAIALAAGTGLAASGIVADVLARAESLTAAHAFATADTLGRDEDAFATFMDLLRAAISDAVRAVARNAADPAQRKLIGTRPLAAWVDVWHALTKLQHETEGLHMDKRQALITGFGLLAKGP
jgi:DNA polymerase-3 subunit delta'